MKRFRICCSILLLIVFLLFFCYSFAEENIILQGINRIQQTGSYSCGGASSLMILRYAGYESALQQNGISGSQADVLYWKKYGNSTGMTDSNILNGLHKYFPTNTYARASYSLTYNNFVSIIIGSLNLGCPVISNVNWYNPQNHWIVIYGIEYDQSGTAYFLLHDPASGNKYNGRCSAQTLYNTATIVGDSSSRIVIYGTKTITSSLPEIPSISGGTAPTSLANNTPFGLKGTVSCKYTITEVRGCIYNCTTGTKIFDVAVNPNNNSYTIGNETIDNNLIFNDSRLNNSWCRYELKVTYNKDGEICIKRLYDRFFKVGSPANMVLAQTGIYEFACDEEARSGPAEANSIVKRYNKGDIVQVIGYEINASNNVWLQLTDGSYVFSGDLNYLGSCTHSNSTTISTKVSPTCTEPGVSETVCNECGEVISTSTIPALGHQPGEWIVVTQPTSGVAGRKEQRCTRCNVLLDAQDVIISVTGVSLNENGLYVVIPNETLLEATITPDNATNKNLIWTSSDPSVATVDSNGHIKTVGLGQTTIIVTTEDGGYTASCVIHTFVSGFCGEDVYWYYFGDTNRLHIYGNGAIPDYENLSERPWSEYESQITSVTVAEGITDIGKQAFYKLTSLNSISLPSTLKTIGENAYAA